MRDRRKEVAANWPFRIPVPILRTEPVGTLAEFLRATMACRPTRTQILSRRPREDDSRHCAPLIRRGITLNRQIALDYTLQSRISHFKLINWPPACGTHLGSSVFN